MEFVRTQLEQNGLALSQRTLRLLQTVHGLGTGPVRWPSGDFPVGEGVDDMLWRVRCPGRGMQGGGDRSYEEGCSGELVIYVPSQ
jgi:hypothetical protein